MPLDAQQSNAQLDTSYSASALLNASCQAVIDARIQAVNSPWYTNLAEELALAQGLSNEWLSRGMPYFNQSILNSVTSCATAFSQAQPDIEQLFSQLAQGFSLITRMRLVVALQSLQEPVQMLLAQGDAYAANLKSFEQRMAGVQAQMQQTVAQVQAQEAGIQSQISSINTAIAQMQQQIQTDRAAIASARSSETSGIVETIFGVLLAPLTGGASLVLAGIGVASIADAETQVSQLQSTIDRFQQQIAGDQNTLSNDQRTVATLKGLTMSADLVLTDLNTVAQALDTLRTSWAVFNGELGSVVQRLMQAQDSGPLVVDHAWFEAACNTWALISQHARDMLGSPVNSLRYAVG